MILHTLQWPYALSGLLVGALVGLTGVGGGSLMTPLLVLLFGINPATAVGTDLLFACATKSTGMALHAARGSVDWAIVRRLSAGSVPAAALTLYLLGGHRHVQHGQRDITTTTLGVALILTALGIVFRRQVVDRLAPLASALPDGRRTALTVALGAALGTLVSISSIGAGAVGATILLVLYPRLPLLQIVASDLAHAVPLTLVAGIGHWVYGSVDFAVLASLLVGSLPGIALTSLFAHRVPDEALRPLVAATLATIGFRLAG